MSLTLLPIGKMCCGNLSIIEFPKVQSVGKFTEFGLPIILVKVEIFGGDLIP